MFDKALSIDSENISVLNHKAQLLDFKFDKQNDALDLYDKVLQLEHLLN